MPGGHGLFNAVGNLSGFLRPCVVGYVRMATGSDFSGFLVFAAFLLIAAAILLFLGSDGR